MLQADSTIDTKFGGSHLAVRNEDDVDVSDGKPCRVGKFPSLNDRLQPLSFIFDQPQTSEYPLDHTVRLQHRHTDVGEKMVDGYFTQVVETSLQLFLQQE